MTFKNEAELQKLMLKAIRSDALSELIEDVAGVTVDEGQRAHQFPQFSIDHLSRQACLAAGKRVMESFAYLEVLTADQNVSLTLGEIMRPDIVCINAEQQTIVMFELKVTAATGRQALTELIAYEQELKNTLPFLAEYDVCHVLVSPEWSTLMDHSVASSVTWSGRQVLCLEAGLSKKKLALKTRIPEAWKVTGAAHFPEEGLPCVTICLYDLDAYSPEKIARSNAAETRFKAKKERKAQQKEDGMGPPAAAAPPAEDATEQPPEPHDPVKIADELDVRIWTAMSIIAREGDRIGGHGFALLWKDTSEISLTTYNITVCGVAPVEFYKKSRLRGTVMANDGRLVAALDKFVRDHDPDGLSQSVLHTAQSADVLLREVSNPALEGWSNWATERLQLSSRAIPLLCEFWGALGDFARAYVLHPAVRTHRRGLLRNGFGDWRDPSVGLPLIQSFTKPDIFYEGEVRCSDAFRLGVLIGLDRLLRLNIRDHDNTQFRARYEWNRIEMMAAVDEVRVLANAAINVEAPERPFTFNEDPLVDDDMEGFRFIRWLTQQFLGENGPVIGCFMTGFFGAIAFDSAQRRSFLDPGPEDEVLVPMTEPLSDMTRAILGRARTLANEGSLPDKAAAAFRQAQSSLSLPRSFAAKDLAAISIREMFSAWNHTVQVADGIFESVFHRHARVAHSQLDWTWFKQGVREARARGEKSFGVVLLANGQFVTGRTSPPEMGDFEMHNDDPENKVIFLDRSNGIGVMRVVTWADLASGKAYGAQNVDATTDDGAADPNFR